MVREDRMWVGTWEPTAVEGEYILRSDRESHIVQNSGSMGPYDEQESDEVVRIGANNKQWSPAQFHNGDLLEQVPPDRLVPLTIDAFRRSSVDAPLPKQLHF
ncbi:unnamed protein product [Polarella glacialis]|nr:unnamed protein product [Polarella glacialis]